MMASTASPSSNLLDEKPFIRKRKPRRRASRKDPNAHFIGCCALLASCLFLVLLYKAQEILDSVATKTDFRLSANVLLKRMKKSSRKVQRKFPSTVVSKYQPPSDLSKPPPNKFLIFDADLAGQGMGNVVSGLLAAHLLALEFDRLVCTKYPMLFEAFELAHPWSIDRCPNVLSDLDAGAGGEPKSISLINFLEPPDECRLKKDLGSDWTYVIMIGNTYPRWPAVPDNFFFTYYRPTKEFLKILPFDPDSPPSTVVHLREPDGSSDPRKGLDKESLKALGEALPLDTYLVTNRVDWYDYFETNFHWRHPGWSNVRHSADGRLRWGERQQKPLREISQTLQMWADWYVMLTADKVYHTHSDFSISAIHWMNLDSLSLQGIENGRLQMVNESWRVDGETAPLVDRTVDGKGTSNLRMCADS